jgi:hypothetical protein
MAAIAMAADGQLCHDSPSDTLPLEASFSWTSAAVAAARTSVGKSIIVFLLGGVFGRIVEHWNQRNNPPRRPAKKVETPLSEVRLTPVCCADAREIAGECPVCLHDFEDREPCCKLVCGHIFHRDCINRWLARGSRSCPICRMDAGAPPAGRGPDG